MHPAQPNEAKAFNRACEEFCDKLESGEVSPTAWFAALQNLLRQQSFLSFDKTWYLFWSLEQLWQPLLHQHPKLLQGLLVILEEVYPHLKDQQAQFIISELLGEYYANEAALNVISRLSQSTKTNDEARGLMPHALQHFVKTNTDQTLRTRARQELARLSADAAIIVQREAKLALAICAKYPI